MYARMEWRKMYRITPITQLSREEKVNREEEEKVKDIKKRKSVKRKT